MSQQMELETDLVELLIAMAEDASDGMCITDAGKDQIREALNNVIDERIALQLARQKP